MQKLQYQGENAKYMHARQNFTHEERASGMQRVKNLPDSLRVCSRYCVVTITH